MIDPKMASGMEEIKKLENQLKSISTPILTPDELRIIKATEMLINGKIDKLESKLKEEISAHLETKFQLAEKETELELLKFKCKDLESKYEKVTYRIVESEMKSMRNNLIFSGVPPSHLKSTDDLKTWFYTLLHDLGSTKPCEIGAIHRLKPKYNKPGDVIIRISDYTEKRELFAQHFKMRSIPKYKDVYVQEQFPPEIQEERKILQAVATEARLQFPDISRNISVYENTLFINNTRYKVSTLHMLPDSLKSIANGYNEDDHGIVFFTKRCPLSNHYPCEFEYNGTRYYNGEQLFMVQKARTFDDTECLTQILRTENPAACKGIGKKIKGFRSHEWQQEVEEAITPGLYNKFRDNKVCRNMLLSTGDRLIGEATTEDPWGVGMRLNDPEVLNQQKWTGKKNIESQII